MRALFVAPYLPTPGSGGRTRLTSLMERLAKRHDVRLVAFVGEGQTGEDLIYEGRALPLPPLPRRPGGLGGAARFYAERLTTGLPTFATYVKSATFADALGAECESFRPDVVTVTTTEMAQYLTSIPGNPARVLDLQDVSSRWIGRAAGRSQTRRQKALLWLELLKTRRYEARAARIPEVVLVTSAIERAFLNGLSGVEALELPNGVDTEYFRPMRDVTPADDRLVFVGPLTSQANAQALTWFCERVLPTLRATVTGLRVDVVGEPAGEWPPEITLLGRVEDVRPYMAGAAVNIVPIRVGSGTRYKILEALSMEHAVVSTTVGAEGLDVVDGEHLLLADEPEDFAAAVIELLGAPKRRAHLGHTGRGHVQARFNWDALVERLEEAWDIARARRAPTG